LTQDEFITGLFCRVDDTATDLRKDARSKLWPSELITLGVLFLLRGQSQRRFYNWLSCNFRALFPGLPERTRLFRLLQQHWSWTHQFLAEPGLLNVGDSLSIELVHPRREGRAPDQVGRKGKSNGHWIHAGVHAMVGVKFCPLINGAGRIVDWDAETANVHDGLFQRMLSRWPEVGKLTDSGFHRSGKRGGDCANLLICERGQCNVRMLIETVFSNWVRLWSLKKMEERQWPGIGAWLAFACAAWVPI